MVDQVITVKKFTEENLHRLEKTAFCLATHTAILTHWVFLDYSPDQFQDAGFVGALLSPLRTAGEIQKRDTNK